MDVLVHNKLSLSESSRVTGQVHVLEISLIQGYLQVINYTKYPCDNSTQLHSIKWLHICHQLLDDSFWISLPNCYFMSGESTVGMQLLLQDVFGLSTAETPLYPSPGLYTCISCLWTTEILDEWHYTAFVESFLLGGSLMSRMTFSWSKFIPISVSFHANLPSATLVSCTYSGYTNSTVLIWIIHLEYFFSINWYCCS